MVAKDFDAVPIQPVVEHSAEKICPRNLKGVGRQETMSFINDVRPSSLESKPAGPPLTTFGRD